MYVRERSVTRPSVMSQYMDVHGRYPDPWKVGVIKRMCKQCVPGSFLHSPKSLGMRLFVMDGPLVKLQLDDSCLINVVATALCGQVGITIVPFSIS